MEPLSITGKCQNCHEREATLWWAGDAGWLAVTHGFAQPWCEACAVQAQLDQARDFAGQITSLEEKLAQITGTASEFDPDKLKDDLLDVACRHGLNVTVSRTSAGVTVRSQDARLNAENGDSAS